jgi:thiamine pyrophosphate-dependent acetolactate synthase large subunit-like protein
VTERRPVVLMMPIDIQPAEAASAAPSRPPPPPLSPPRPSAGSIAAAVDVLRRAERPAIIAGRGAVLADAGEQLEALGAHIGAILATSAPANGLFSGLPFALGISGGFASPFAQQTLPQADVVLVAGASVNHWTTKHGAMIGADAKVIQIDLDPRAIARNRPVDVGVVGDVGAAAEALLAELRAGEARTGFRTDALAHEIAARRWHDEPYEDASTEEWIDPRTLSRALEDRLPRAKSVAVDSGHFLGYPSMFLSVPDANAWVFPNGFQAVGLGLGNAIGAAIARPDRPAVAAIGDGGAFMALAEIETAARLKLGNLVVVIYDDAAYGAEVHHFAPMGHDTALVTFPDADLAAIARAAGASAATIRAPDDLGVIDEWLANPSPSARPLVLDAKVNPTICAEWLEEAFRAG